MKELKQIKILIFQTTQFIVKKNKKIKIILTCNNII